MKTSGALWLPVALVVASNVAYHVAQRTIPPQASSAASVVVSYLTALVVTLGIWPLLKQPVPFLAAFRTLNVSSVVLGFTIVGVEFGFLLAYRAGWPVRSVALTSGTLLALILIPIGVLAFHESVSLRHLAGVCLCLAGLYLLQSG